jgi:hypothetical protein
MDASSPFEQGTIRPPHPLALRLAARLRVGTRALDVGAGRGRNAAAFTKRGVAVAAVSEEDASALRLPGGTFEGALVTHALLHGMPEHIAALVALIAARLAPAAAFAATFASTQDRRFGEGERLGEQTFAPTSGDERGVAHSYFNDAQVRALLEPVFAIVTIEEVSVDDVAGRWAHPTAPLQGAVHWFVEATRR